jgi:amidase
MSAHGATPHALTAAAAARAIRARDLTSEELVASCLERIAERDPQVKAWRYLDPELALEQARARDREEPGAPLHGVPVGLKDVIDTADMPTRYGTPIHEQRRPERDARCVEALRAAGAVILGKTVTTELATWHPAETTNPHDPGHTPGGSSSGSAAAVADAMVPLALGTQTVGSTIRPAAFCGALGMKPTFGAVDMTGVIRTSERLDTIGLFARHPDDLELLLGSLLGTPLPPSPGGGRPRVGLVRTPWWEHAQDSSRHAVEGAAEALRAAGLDVAEAELPHEFDDLPDIQDVVAVTDIARNLRWEFEQHPDLLSDDLRGRIERGLRTPDAEYEAAVAAGDRARAALDGVFSGFDVMLAPAVTGEAPAGLGWTGDPVFVRPWSLLGTPATTVPAARGPAGLPVGVQLIAPVGADRALLDATAELHRALGGDA